MIVSPTSMYVYRYIKKISDLIAEIPQSSTVILCPLGSEDPSNLSRDVININNIK